MLYLTLLLSIIVETAALDDQYIGVMAVCGPSLQNDSSTDAASSDGSPVTKPCHPRHRKREGPSGRGLRSRRFGTGAASRTAQTSNMEFEEAVLKLTGAGEMEELEESVLEMYEELGRHPLPINSCGRSRLLSSGLFSRYQVATLLDYRQRCGDILSVTELGTIDGFGIDFALTVRNFISFDGDSGLHKKGLRQNLTLKASGRLDGASAAACGGVKYHAELADRLELNWSDRNTYSDPSIDPGTINITYYGRRFPGKVIAGDYNARFGQGLLLWTGFSLSGVSSAQSLWRSGTGLSPSKSFSTTYRGLAADVSFGKWCASAAFDCGTGVPRGLVNINRTGRIWQTGVTGTAETGRQAVSADWRIGFGGGAFFGEVAAERRNIEETTVATATSLACIAGLLWVPSYGTTLSFAARAYPKSFSGTSSGAVRSSSKVSDEQGLSLAFQNSWLTLTGDAARHPSKDSRQIRALAHLKPSFDAGVFKLAPSLRFTWKGTASSEGDMTQRYDMRAEMGATAGRWSAAVRYNAVHCRDWSWMSYAEAGWKGVITVWLRGGVFRVDNWDDRIYVYERDAPGNFNVPVCYGRGWNASAVTGLKIGTRHSLWFRASVVAYPWMTEKNGRCELKLQYSLSLTPPYRKTSRE